MQEVARLLLSANRQLLDYINDYTKQALANLPLQRSTLDILSIYSQQANIFLAEPSQNNCNHLYLTTQQVMDKVTPTPYLRYFLQGLTVLGFIACFATVIALSITGAGVFTLIGAGLIGALINSMIAAAYEKSISTNGNSALNTTRCLFKPAPAKSTSPLASEQSTAAADSKDDRTPSLVPARL